MQKRITIIGDTHGCHHQLSLTPGFMLIHTGDVTAYGTEGELYDFLTWLIEQPFNYKLFVAGNHDLCLDTTNPPFVSELPANVIYLNHQSINIEGINLFGSPISPYQAGMAFNRHRGQEINNEWQAIPSNTDILITHTPPMGILDHGAGCENLMSHVMRIQPSQHLFGHVHEGYGQFRNDKTLFVNASLSNIPDFITSTDYQIINKPISVSFNKR